jgi:hypothetical protein
MIVLQSSVLSANKISNASVDCLLSSYQTAYCLQLAAVFTNTSIRTYSIKYTQRKRLFSTEDNAKWPNPQLAWMCPTGRYDQLFGACSGTGPLIPGKGRSRDSMKARDCYSVTRANGRVLSQPTPCRYSYLLE